ncbi:MAG: hypothetical protein E7566_06805 [Ruminococcaceae bacterium]|nr:hypothetical protein [Oscillospiraceae bacterium]
MDTFCEQVVSRKNGVKQHVIAWGMIVFFLLLEIFFILLFLLSFNPFWGVLVLMIGIAAAFIVAKAVPSIFKVEYDYSVVGNFLYIDKVIASKKRKKLNKVEIGNITEFDIIKNDNVPNVKYAKTYECSKGGYEGNYYCIYNESERGKCLMIFSPNEKIIEGMRPYMTREVVMKYFYKK